VREINRMPSLFTSTDDAANAATGHRRLSFLTFGVKGAVQPWLLSQNVPYLIAPIAGVYYQRGASLPVSA